MKRSGTKAEQPEAKKRKKREDQLMMMLPVLPNEIWCNIIGWVRPKMVFQLLMVCKDWHELITECDIFKLVYKRQFGGPLTRIIPERSRGDEEEKVADREFWRRTLKKTIITAHNNNRPRNGRESACCKLLWAAREGHHRYARHLIRKWDAKSYDITDYDPRGGPAIYVAIEEGHSKVVKVILQYSTADVDYYIDCYGTLLLLAVSYRDIDTARVLIKYGADVNARGDDGATPLSVALQRDQLEMIDLLVSHGATVEGEEEREDEENSEDDDEESEESEESEDKEAMAY